MRVAIAVLVVVGCKSEKIDKADKLEPPPPEIVVAPPPPPPPPPAAPLDTQWMRIHDVPDPSVQDALKELLRPFPLELSICVAIDSAGTIYLTRAYDAAGARVTDDKQQEELEALVTASRTHPLPMRDETAKAVAGTWVCTREPEAAPPQNVPPTTLEGRRIAGEKNIVPDDETKAEIARSNKDRIITAWKVCIDASGAVASTKALKSSGFAAYDAKIERAIKDWKYRPYTTPAGKPVPVCTAVTFIYSQK